MAAMNQELLEEICLSKPGATYDIKWGKDLCYLIGEKMFCVTGTEPPFHIGFKTTPEDFADLVERPGVVPAKYLARAKWVTVQDLHALSREEWLFQLEQAYQLVFGKLTKKLQREIRGE